jgi:hypothetical protein
MMAEKVTIGTATLYLGDAREVLPRLRGEFAIISDPPYGINYSHGTRKPRPGFDWAGRDRHAGVTIVGDDEPFDPRWLAEHTEDLVLWGADHFRARLPQGGRFLAWNKLAAFEKVGATSFCDVEFAWHSRRAPARVFSHLWKGVCTDKTHELSGHFRRIACRRIEAAQTELKAAA